MPREPADTEAQDEAKDQAHDEVSTADASEQGQKFGRDAEDERKRAEEAGETVETPEGEFPADAKGFDGAPLEEILKDREERLAEENRPENTEVSNAGREFDGEKGMFTDEEGYEEAEKKYTLE
ncbi:hypothetical protein [Nocardioides antri]|uniref:Uncharacterized protein n=1 Tax=Nocardioides antri TaxID=2607659 RepID=A0A5B1M7F5_9ACTN|nr:hypothetical protein [Nocardioides antri]KAA1428438.1 hypothetical protein F0U47_05840 [Nocardioides antri]